MWLNKSDGREMMITRSKLIASIGIGHLILLVIWISFLIAHQGYAHIWQGGLFHTGTALCVLWPLSILYALIPVEEATSPWLIIPFIYVFDAIAYSIIGFLVVSLIKPVKKKSYIDEL